MESCLRITDIISIIILLDFSSQLMLDAGGLLGLATVSVLARHQPWTRPGAGQASPGCFQGNVILADRHEYRRD
jgi:hypothetical protein